ncbi:MAG: prepilin-type N-terminal cleavage/methylation protein [Homoserinimonas sp.]|jgi:type II secretory pathway pseudopilin PulG|nr:prepilin-type N-terminal cleavage/methylation protein [Homoserinimonas sp.]
MDVRTRSETSSAEQGFTLIELLVYSLLLMVVLAIVGSVLISSMRVERTVRRVTQTSSAGQLAVASVETGIRNSSGFFLTAVGADQLLLARTARGTAAVVWGCEAWYYSASAGTIHYKHSTAIIPTPNASQLNQWLLLVDGVTPNSGSTIFLEVVSGKNLDIVFNVSADDNPNIAIASSAVSRAGPGGAPLCY